jgi:hypothetical protein
VYQPRLHSQRLAEGLFHVIADDLVVGDVDVVEDGLIEFPPDVVARVDIQRLDVAEQVEEDRYVAASSGDVSAGGRELTFEIVARAADLSQSLPDAF